MTAARPRRDRPSLREALAAAATALAVGAVMAWTTAPVAAAPVPVTVAAADPFAAVITTGPAWIVSPRAARPGEVVHVRLKFTPTIDPATGQAVVPQVVFAFRNDLRTLTPGHYYAAEGTFGVDLVVPPGTDWGFDPIVWASVQAGIAVVPTRLLTLASRNALIPFVATRSAQPPLWNR